MKTIIVLLTMLFCSKVFLYSSDFSDFYDKVTGAFESFGDPNAGSTVFRSLGIPYGGRSEAMGTAFTAMSDDVAFMNYNPAVSAVLPLTELAVFHNFWIADSAVDSIVFSQRKGNFGYGAALKSFYVPFTEYNLFGTRVSKGYYSETIGNLNLAYNILAGYDFKGITLGTNLKVGYRGVPNYSDDMIDQVIAGSGLDQSAVAVMADIGLLFRFNIGKMYSSREPNFNIGLAVTNLGAAFTNLGTKPELDDSLPTAATLGISYKILKPITISFDFQQPFNMFNIGRSEKFSFCFGLEGVITDFFSLQTGFLLKGANPKFSLGAQVDWEKITFSMAYSLDLTSSLNPVNRVSLSAKVNFGDEGRALHHQKVDDLYSRGLNLYLIGEFTKAIEVWEEALSLYPRFDPALDGIFAAKQSIELRKTIEDVQNLDSEL